MRKLFLPIFLIICFSIPVFSQLQGDMFEAREGFLATKDSLKGEELVSVLGMMTPDFPFIFDIESGKFDAWLYVYRSVSDTTFFSMYAVIKTDTVWTVFPLQSGLEAPAGIKTIDKISWMGSDTLISKLNQNQEFSAYRAIHQNVDSVQLGLIYMTMDVSDSVPPQFINQYVWLINLNNDIQCMTNALTGETLCEIILTAVNDAKSDNHTKLYPNPATDKINISLTDSKPVKIQVFDMSGNNVMESSTEGTNNQISLKINDLPAGTYLLKKFDRNKYSTIKFSVIR